MKTMVSALFILGAIFCANDAMAQKSSKAAGTPRTVEGTLKRKSLKTHAQYAPCMRDYAINDYFYVIEGAGEKETLLNTKTYKTPNYAAMLNKRVKVTGAVRGSKVTESGKDHNCIILDIKSIDLK